MAFTPFSSDLPTTQPIAPQASSGGFTPYNQSMPNTPQQNQVGTLPPPPRVGPMGNNLAQDSIGQAFQGGMQQTQEGAQQAQNGGFVSGLEGGVKMVAGAANAAFSPLAPLTKPLGDTINYGADKISNIPAVQKFALSGAGQVTARVAEDVGNLSTVAATGAGLASPEVKNTVNSVAKTTQKTAGAVKEGFSPTLKPNETVGQIIQGKTEDIPAAQRTLSSTDTSGIKTYQQLQTKLNSEIPKLSKQVDAEYGKDTSGGHSIKSFEQTVGTGKGAVKVNYVSQAIQQLKDLYTKTGDAKGLSAMKTIENKAKINGLTSGDINQLARRHGADINAFNANGEASSGLTKQAAENTRMGLKTTARSYLSTPEAKGLDARLSDIYDTKALIDKMTEKVNAAAQKTPKQGVIPKTIGKVIKTADMLTGNPLRAIGKEMGALGSSGALSPAEIEANLEKNLSSLKKPKP